MKKTKNINPYIIYTETLVDVIKEMYELNKSYSSKLNPMVGYDKTFDNGVFNGVNNLLYQIQKRFNLEMS